jgi:hypothetical protein
MLGTVLIVIFTTLWGGFFIVGGVLIIKRELSPEKTKIRPKLTGWRAYTWAWSLIISGIALTIGYGVGLTIEQDAPILNWIIEIPYILPGITVIFLSVTQTKQSKKR